MSWRNVNVEWLAWSDHGGGVTKGNATRCAVRPTLQIKDLWAALERQNGLPGAPAHYSRLWVIRGGRFMHDATRTVDSYGLAENSTLVVLLRCNQPLVTG